jgi:hypothetical protein
VAQGDILQQMKQIKQLRPLARFQRSFARMRGAFSDFFYIFFL